MWSFVLDHAVDLISFALLILAVALAANVWLHRSGVKSGLGRMTWVVLAILLAGGAVTAYHAGEQERNQFRLTLQGFAPTYAEELSRLGHAQIGFGTAEDDPNYLKLIETQKRWLKVNPAVNDIYTFRKNSEGKICFVVDSETDYNRNGQYDEDREQRTAIGEIYPEATEAFEKALAGTGAFDGVPASDRWGVWVTATCPIYGPDGTVEAAVGVDFDAHSWVRAILFRRAAVLGFAAVAVAILIGSSTVVSLARSEIKRRRDAEEIARRAESRMQTILDNEPEGVIVCTTNGEMRQLNPSGIHLFELDSHARPVGQSLLAFVPSHDQPLVMRWLKEIADGKPGLLTIRIIGSRGGEKWIEAHAVPMKWDHESVVEVLIVARDVTSARAAEAERDRLQSELVAASRQAGMADIATGILHNVGNVLNTINVSAHVLNDKLRQSRVTSLGKAAGLLIEQRATLAEFLTNDQRGKKLPDYLDMLAGSLRNEQEEMLSTLRGMSDGLDHLKAIVQSQQSFAGNVRVEEILRPGDVFHEAAKLNLATCERHNVNLVFQLQEIPPLLIDKHKTMQILINLISNAKDAIKSANRTDGQITLRMTEGQLDGWPSIRFEVHDNGIGVPPENMSKIFAMGFTTRKEGHGFGLHSAANFAKEMGGRLTVESDGPGKGASFILELPAKREIHV